MFLVAALFPVYYNVLSQFVSRRDELVLKRMRTGETRDAELLVSIALPGRGQRAAADRDRRPDRAALRPAAAGEPAALRGAAVLAITMFTAFAYWTAAWTRSAEAAQLTSMPIIILASLGPIGAALPGRRTAPRLLVAHAGRRDVGPGAGRLVRLRRPGRRAGDADLRRDLGPAAEPLLVIAAWTVARRRARPALDALGAALLRRGRQWRRWSELSRGRARRALHAPVAVRDAVELQRLRAAGGGAGQLDDDGRRRRCSSGGRSS